MLPPLQACSQMLRPAITCFYPMGVSNEHADAFSVCSNPAASASLKVFTVGVYSERRYLLNGLSNYLLSAALPLKRGGAGLSIKHLSAGAFRQSEISLAYAKKLGQVDIGAQFNYHKLSIAGYGKAATIIIDFGSVWRINDQFQAAIGIYNPAGGRSGKINEKIGYTYKGLSGYKVSGQLLLFVEFIKQENKPVNIRAGLQYAPAPAIILYGGIAAATAQPYGAVSMQWKGYRIMIGVSLHQQLGITPGLGLIYINNENKNGL